MSKHINHQDVQDRLILKNNNIVKHNKHKKLSLEDRDPGTLSILEQETLIREKISAKIKLQQSKPQPKPPIRYTGKKY